MAEISQVRASAAERSINSDHEFMLPERVSPPARSGSVGAIVELGGCDARRLTRSDSHNANASARP